MPPDHVKRMTAWLERHKGAVWHRPPVGTGGDHVASWTQADADPKQDGVEQTASHNDLGRLMDYLEALERATMNVPEPKRIAAR